MLPADYTYATYDESIMEAVRQLTLDEMQRLVADIAQLLIEDRLRDVGVGALVGRAVPARVNTFALRHLVHTLESSNIEVKGKPTLEHYKQTFGDDKGESLWNMIEDMYQYTNAVGKKMIEEGMPQALAVQAVMLDRDPELKKKLQDRAAAARHPSMGIDTVRPTDFGWPD